MKIVIDLTSLADNFSGIERYAASIAKAMINMADPKDKFMLIFKGEVHDYFKEIVNRNNVITRVVPACNKLMFNQLRLPMTLRRIKADYYIFPAFPVPVLTHKKGMISAIHDICFYDCPETMKTLSKWYFRISDRIAVKKCDKILTISEFSKKRIMERLKCPEGKILIAYCGVDDCFRNLDIDVDKLRAIKEKYNLPDSYILTLSTVEPRKRLPLLLGAYTRLVKKKKIDIPLVLAGRKAWGLDELIDSIDKSVAEKVIITDYIDDEDLPYVYMKAEGFIFPSMYEGFGIPPVEAMSCGTGVLSSDASSMPEVLGDAAIYFKSGDKRDLRNGIIRLLGMTDDERNALVNKGRERAKLYNWDIEAGKILKNLEDMM